MGPPETTIWEYPGEDLSWRWEIEDFVRASRNGSGGGPSLRDAKAVLEIVKEVYRGCSA